MQIELGKTYRTRDGREVRIYATDGGGIYSVHGAIESGDVWQVTWWKADGRAPEDWSSRDLIEVKPRIVLERWVNMYRVNGELRGHHHHSQAAADSAAGDGRIAFVKIVIDCEEGEGLLNGR